MAHAAAGRRARERELPADRVPVHHGPEAHELAGHGAQRRDLGRLGHAGGDARHVPRAADRRQLPADRHRHPDRRRGGVVDRQARRDDRHAADDRALQRHGRRRGGGDRGGRTVPRRNARAHDREPGGAGRHHRRRFIQRQPHRVRQAPGPDQAQPPLPRPAGAECPDPRRRVARRRTDRARLQCHGERHHRVLRAGADPRHHDDAPHRRRRHAGRDLALQRPHRSRGRLRGLRAQQRRDDHRRHRGRFRGHAAHAVDGESDEPLTRQRALQRLRRERRGNRWRSEREPQADRSGRMSA